MRPHDRARAKLQRASQPWTGLADNAEIADIAVIADLDIAMNAHAVPNPDVRADPGFRVDHLIYRSAIYRPRTHQASDRPLPP